MGDSAAHSTGWRTRIESLLAIALGRSSTGSLAFEAFQNRGQIGAVDEIDDQAAPANVIIAAAQLTRRASGLFVVTGSLFATTSAADEIGLTLLQTGGPFTAFSGGTLSTDGKWRTFRTSPVVATAGGSTHDDVTALQPVAGAQATALQLTGIANTTGVPVGAQLLVTLNLTASSNLTLISFGQLLFYELP